MSRKAKLFILVAIVALLLIVAMAVMPTKASRPTSRRHLAVKNEVVRNAPFKDLSKTAVRQDDDNGIGVEDEDEDWNGDDPNGDDPNGDDQNGDNGDDQNGDDQNGDDQNGDDQNGDDQNGDDLNGDDQNGDDQNGDDQNGDDQNGDDLNGDDQNGDDQNGDDQNGDDQNGDDQNGDDLNGDNGDDQNGDDQNGDNGDEQNGAELGVEDLDQPGDEGEEENEAVQQQAFQGEQNMDFLDVCRTRHDCYDDHPFWSIAIPADIPSTIYSPQLTRNRWYLIRCYGTWKPIRRRGYFCDCRWCTRNGWDSRSDTLGGYDYGLCSRELSGGDACSDNFWRPNYSRYHSYCYEYRGRGRSVDFRVRDPLHFNNRGVLYCHIYQQC